MASSGSPQAVNRNDSMTLATCCLRIDRIGSGKSLCMGEVQVAYCRGKKADATF
jgi:hypothetical protein